MLQSYYDLVAARLDRVDFSAIWPGFHPSAFALYNAETACYARRVFPRPPVFRGNTAISWQNQPLAIWYLEGQPDPDRLAAGLVHEMFHAFQQESGEGRFPQDLLLLFAPSPLQALAFKWRAGQLLAEAVELSASREEVLQLLNHFCGARRQSRLISPGFPQECLAETIEGMAEFAGLQALRAISPDKYQLDLAQKQRNLKAPGPLLLDARRMAYETGALLLTAAQAAGISLAHPLSGQTEPLYSFLDRHFPLASPPESPNQAQYQTIRALQRTQEQARATLVTRFLQGSPNSRHGRFRICGYDPMNQFPAGHRLFCSHFLALKDLEAGKTLLFEGPCLLDLVPGTVTEGNKIYYQNEPAAE